MGNAGDMHLPKGRAALIKLGTKQKKHPQAKSEGVQITMVAGQDLNLRPSGYEPDELRGCSVQGMMQSQRCCV